MHRVVIALTALLTITAAVVVAGYLLVFGAGTDRAAQLVPAGTPVYLNVYLQPSTGQQMNLSGLLTRLPGFSDQASLDEKLDQLAQNLLREAGLDYRAEVRPWLGDQIAVAFDADFIDTVEAEALVLVAVKDEPAADQAMASIVERSQASAIERRTYQGMEIRIAETASWAFLDDVMVAGQSADAVERAIDVQRGAIDSLGASSRFRSAMDRLPADHLASAYLDLEAVAAAGGETPGNPFSAASLALVAEPDALRLTGSAPFDRDAADDGARAGFALGTEPSSLTDWMPDDTQASVVVFGARQMFEQIERSLAESPDGAEVAQGLTAIRAIAAFSIGINIDTDVLPLFDREAAIAIGRLDGEPAGQLLLRPSDPDAALVSLERLRDGLERAGAMVETTGEGGQIITTVELPDFGAASYTMSEGIVILALRAEDVQAVLDARTADRTLARTDGYTSTFRIAGERAGNEIYINVSGLVDAIGLEAEMPPDIRDILRSIGSFGLTTPSRDDHVEIRAVLTVE